MTSAHSSSRRTYVFDLQWDEVDFRRLFHDYAINRREIILPAFLYSLLPDRNSYPMEIFFRAHDNVEQMIDRIMDGADFSGDDYEHYRSMLYSEIQCLGKKLSQRTSDVRQVIEHPDQIQEMRLANRSLYVTINPPCPH